MKTELKTWIYLAVKLHDHNGSKRSKEGQEHNVLRHKTGFSFVAF